jgi:hypothetical protein
MAGAGEFGGTSKLWLVLADYLVLKHCKDLLVRGVGGKGVAGFGKSWEWRGEAEGGEPALGQESPYIQKMKEQN